LEPLLMKLQVTLTNGTAPKAYEAPIVLYYVGPAGELHVDYSNGASVRNDETHRAATIAPGLWATVEIVEQPAEPQLRKEWDARQEAAERMAAEPARTRD
jgi:hypothetical protein